MHSMCLKLSQNIPLVVVAMSGGVDSSVTAAILAQDVRSDKRLDELTNAARADDGMQPTVNSLIEGDGQLLYAFASPATRVVARVTKQSA